MGYYEDNKYRDLYEDLDAHKFGLSKLDCKQLIDIFKALPQPAVADSPRNTYRGISSDDPPSPPRSRISSSNDYNSNSYSNKRVYESDNTPGVYVLRLRDDKYYVGQSDNKRRRIGEHREGRGEGTEFTEKHAVVTEIEPLTEPMTDLNLWELKETLTRMKEHGIENVRGSHWSLLELQPNDIDSIKKLMVTYFTHLLSCLTHSLTCLLTYLLTYLRYSRTQAAILDLCYHCHSDSHYANECIASQEHFL